jgi:RNA polymerase sigma-70 factor (ECF subfamily)
VPLFRRHQQPPWDAVTDDELVVLAQAGQREAFGILYDRYLPRVHGYCYRLLGTPEAAEDATTEVFMRALSALSAYRAGSFRSWLFAIAHNVTLNERHRRQAVPLDAAATMADAATLEEDAVTAADWSHVLTLLPRLSPDQQHVIALRLSGLSAAEIGEALGKPRNAIDGIHHRAVLRLRSLLAMSERVPVTTKGGG